MTERQLSANSPLEPPIPPTVNTRLYAGEELDADLGFINLRARPYNVSTGRFATLDPVMGTPLMPLSWNRYLYANADPVNLVDPLGRAGAVEYGVGIAITAAMLLPMTVRLGFDGRATTYTNATAIAVGAVVNYGFLYAADWVADEAMSVAGLPGDTPAYAPPFQYCNHKRKKKCILLDSELNFDGDLICHYECTNPDGSYGGPKVANLSKDNPEMKVCPKEPPTSSIN